MKVLEKAEKKPFFPKCPCCKTGSLHRIAVFDQHGSLLGILAVAKVQVPVPLNKGMGKGFYAQK